MQMPKQNLYKSILLYIVITFLVTSCIPLIYIEKLSDIASDEFPEIFLKESNKILVLPIWEKAPVYATEDTLENAKSYFGNPIFITASDMEEIHNIIPSTTNFGLVGAGVWFGKNSSIDIIYFISDTSQIVVRMYRSLEHSWIGEKWKNELVETVKGNEKAKGEGFYAYRNEFLWNALGEKEAKVNFPKKEKEQILSFLSAVKPIANGHENHWRSKQELKEI